MLYTCSECGKSLDEYHDGTDMHRTCADKYLQKIEAELKAEQETVELLQADQENQIFCVQLLWKAVRLLELQAGRIDFEGREAESDYEQELLDCKVLFEKMRTFLEYQGDNDG